MVVDDDPHQVELVRRVLSEMDLEIVATLERDQAIDAALAFRPQLVLLDLVMPGVSGMELLERILEINPDCDVILITAHYSTESAVEAIQKGAYDYLTKPIPVARLREKVGKWLQDAQEKEHTAELEARLVGVSSFEGIVGHSPAIREVFSKIRRIAPHYATVLLTGGTGTGKELVARALHSLSPVAQAPFIVCNCAAIAESLFESELFGHVRGAFTGAIQDKEGFIERAAGGTIFLDEIGEIPLAAQAKLLRVIQNHEVQRLGARTVKTVDIRMIAASNRNLREAAGRKEFREDLYYRLATVELHMPPLTERKEDLPLLIQHFLKRFSEQYGKTGLKLTRRAEALLSRYSWPGNVRELENALSYACMIVERDTIDLLDLPKSLRNQWLPWETAQLQEDGFLTLEELDRKYALSVLERLGGNHTRTADVLGIGRATLYRMLAERSPTPRAALGKPVPD